MATFLDFLGILCWREKKAEKNFITSTIRDLKFRTHFEPGIRGNMFEPWVIHHNLTKFSVLLGDKVHKYHYQQEYPHQDWQAYLEELLSGQSIRRPTLLLFRCLLLPLTLSFTHHLEEKKSSLFNGVKLQFAVFIVPRGVGVFKRKRACVYAWKTSGRLITFQAQCITVHAKYWSSSREDTHLTACDNLT